MAGETQILNEDRADRRPGPVLAVLVLAALATLLTLGTWQVQRLQWKNALIERIETRIAAPPAALAEIEALWAEAGDVEYVPVAVEGVFDHAREQHFLATHGGRSGWYVYTPLRLSDGRTLIVNRGFVPYDRKALDAREWTEPAGQVALTGLARDPLSEKPGWVVPDNAPDKNLWYWKDFAAMRAAMGIDEAEVLPFFVDVAAYTAGNDNEYPVPGVTRISLPNSHLQYAVTWYGLAAALAVVAGFMFFRKPNGTGPA